jgi:Mg/Co/Ni transporter MgtE
MSPDFVSVSREGTVASAIAALRSHDVAPEGLNTILLTDSDGVLAGTVTAPQLLRAEGEVALETIAENAPPSVGAEAEVPEVARLMTDYNLVALPVVDADGHPIGIVSVDDVLELTLPDQWRRRYGVARE